MDGKLNYDVTDSKESKESVRASGQIFIPPMAKRLKLLDIAKEIQAYIESKNWSWCDMDKVYKILKTINE